MSQCSQILHFCDSDVEYLTFPASWIGLILDQQHRSLHGYFPNPNPNSRSSDSRLNHSEAIVTKVVLLPVGIRLVPRVHSTVGAGKEPRSGC